jgi:protein disulfide-isomerase A6
MRPEWAKLATRLKGVIKVAKMGAGGKLSFLEGYDFKGYPILVFLPAGKKSKRLFYNYEGPRTVNDMAIWAM